MQRLEHRCLYPAPGKHGCSQQHTVWYTANPRLLSLVGAPTPLLTDRGRGTHWAGAEEKHHHRHRQEDEVPTELVCPSLQPWGGKDAAPSGPLASPRPSAALGSSDQGMQSCRTKIQRMSPTLQTPATRWIGESLLCVHDDLSPNHWTVGGHQYNPTLCISSVQGEMPVPGGEGPLCNHKCHMC